jgi:hypothetical protein
MHKQVTYFVALPVARRDDGTLVYDHNGAVECATSEAAILLASELALARGYTGALANRDPCDGLLRPGKSLGSFRTGLGRLIGGCTRSAMS